MQKERINQFMVISAKISINDADERRDAFSKENRDRHDEDEDRSTNWQKKWQRSERKALMFI